MVIGVRDFHQELAASTIDWWRDAGIDVLCIDEPRNWLVEERLPILAKAVQQPADAPAAQPAPATFELPGSLEDLKTAISSGANIPGMGFSSKVAMPHGEACASIMVMGDVPEEEEIAAGRLGVGQIGKLLHNMLRAIGTAPENAYFATLAPSRPTSGSLDAEHLAELAVFAKHHISLADPQTILLLGSAVCEAMLGKEQMQARGCLHSINHNGRNRAAVATYHPRTLLARPALKAQAWQDLQMLAGKNAL